jgi:hypothetical protein
MISSRAEDSTGEVPNATTTAGSASYWARVAASAIGACRSQAS